MVPAMRICQNVRDILGISSSQYPFTTSVRGIEWTTFEVALTCFRFYDKNQETAGNSLPQLWQDISR